MYVIALDQGTTSTRSILFDHEGCIRSVSQREFAQIFPKPGWVEHDAEVIWDTVLETFGESMEKIGARASDISALGITNQRETTVVWDRLSGKPVYNAIVWQCRRTSQIVDDLRKKGLEDYIKDTTGLIPDAYFSATKIKWILDNVKGIRKRAQDGDLLFGTIDTWLIWKLTGGAVHVTDYTNAARTMLYDIHNLCWDKKLMEILEIPECMMPEVKPSSCVYGFTDPSVAGAAIPVSGDAGDQQAALFGQCCFEKGSAKNTYGTGCFLLMNTGHKPVKSKNGLLTTIAAGSDKNVQYALEGSVFSAGSAIQWIRDSLEMINDASESEKYAMSVKDCAGAYLVPAFTGLGAPYWDQYARGVLVGITRGFTKAHFIRAALESIAYQAYDILKSMEEDSGVTLTDLRVDGGACANNFLLQFQSDIIERKVLRPKCIETTALGAAYLAGLAVGYWKDKKELCENWFVSRTFTPSMPREKREELLDGWRKAIVRSFAWDAK